MKEVKPKVNPGFNAFKEQSIKDKETLSKFMSEKYFKGATELELKMMNHAVAMSGMYEASKESCNQAKGKKELVTYQAACSFLVTMEALGIITIN